MRSWIEILEFLVSTTWTEWTEGLVAHVREHETNPEILEVLLVLACDAFGCGVRLSEDDRCISIYRSPELKPTDVP